MRTVIKSVTSPIDVQLYITRWNGRPVHRNFLRMLDNYDKWKPYLTIAFHGPRLIDDCMATGLVSNRIKGLDFRGFTDGRMPQLQSLVFQDAIEHGYRAIVLIDDDAYWGGNPVEHILKIRKLVCKYGHGATGPITQFRHMAKYKSVDEEFWPMDSQPWSTMGPQVYSVEMLKYTQSMWEPMLRVLKFRCDYNMFLIAKANGYPISEYFVRGYKHTTLAKLERGNWDMWLEKLERIWQDYTYFLPYCPSEDYERIAEETSYHEIRGTAEKMGFPYMRVRDVPYFLEEEKRKHASTH